MSLDTIAFLNTNVCINNPLTEYWNDNNFLQIEYSFPDTLQVLGCVFLVSRCNIIKAS